jgi:hypothetical protein
MKVAARRRIPVVGYGDLKCEYSTVGRTVGRLGHFERSNCQYRFCCFGGARTGSISLKNSIVPHLALQRLLGLKKPKEDEIIDMKVPTQCLAAICSWKCTAQRNATALGSIFRDKKQTLTNILALP